MLDAYEGAEIGTNAELLSLRHKVLEDFYEILLINAVSQLTQHSVAQQLAEKAKQDLLATSEVILTNQNPWILHANLARKLEL